MSNDKELLVLMCAPLSKYPEQPYDISKSRQIDCPHCKKPMWLSEKKEKLMRDAILEGKITYLTCHICLQEQVLRDPLLLIGMEAVNI